MTGALGIALLSLQLPGLMIGKDAYTVGPPLRLAKSLSYESFSRDGQFLTFIDENVEGSYASEKDKIAKKGSGIARALVRVDLKRGTRQILYTTRDNEVLMRAEPVGAGGDVLCSIAVGVPEGDLITWKALYFPETGGPVVVVPEVRAKSFQIAASRRDRKAFILVCVPGAKSRLIYLAEGRASDRELPFVSSQGLFFLRTASGSVIANFQGPPPDYRVIANMECSFDTGVFTEATDLTAVELEKPQEPLVTYSLEKRSPGAPDEGESPLCSLFVSSRDSGSKRLLVAQGVITDMSASLTGLAVVYAAPDGYFLRELVKITAKA